MNPKASIRNLTAISSMPKSVAGIWRQFEGPSGGLITVVVMSCLLHDIKFVCSTFFCVPHICSLGSFFHCFAVYCGFVVQNWPMLHPSWSQIGMWGRISIGAVFSILILPTQTPNSRGTDWGRSIFGKLNCGQMAGDRAELCIGRCPNVVVGLSIG